MQKRNDLKFKRIPPPLLPHNPPAVIGVGGRAGGGGTGGGGTRGETSQQAVRRRRHVIVGGAVCACATRPSIIARTYRLRSTVCTAAVAMQCHEACIAFAHRIRQDRAAGGIPEAKIEAPEATRKQR